jgi:asparagine synthase (glutamine-hydrolysing)
MCGIAGFLSPVSSSEEELRRRVLSMTASISHRGPDDSGEWADAEAGIAIGFRRLAILDLSPAGHQPMMSSDGRYVIIFNGEVYNFLELGYELERRGHKFQGHSDTEVMLAAICEWGLEPSVKKFVGMFAFAVWDRHERLIHLVRDRIGIKPLYYGWMEKTFLFGSELKALRAHPNFSVEVDRNAIALQLQYSYVPSPRSIYKGISKLPPGTILTISAGCQEKARAAVPVPFWSALKITQNGVIRPYHGSEQEAREELDSLLREAVRLQMIADVPLGAFLSGGVDSSLVVALMQAQSSRPVKTFTVGFPEQVYDEAPHAKAVASHLGTDHTQLYVTPQDALSVIPKLPAFFDEPFSDSSQIPTYLISKLTRRHVAVSLSGDGGDELFGGYNRYLWASASWRSMHRVPAAVRRLLASGIQRLPSKAWDGIFRFLKPMIPATWRMQSPGEKMHKLARLLPAARRHDLYLSLVAHAEAPNLLIGAEPISMMLSSPAEWPKLPDFAQQMMLLDLVTYLPDDILVKVDRASMAVSLEARVPLLDHRVVEFANHLPLSMKIRNHSGKWLLRQVLYGYVPRKLIERPKMGFGVPIGQWLRGPLREWAEDLLSEGRLHREGYFDTKSIRSMWLEHLSEKCNRQYELWDILMFQAWHQYWEES